MSADFMSQPVEYRGRFTCSDEALNSLWKSGRWSTQICMITHHLDSPQHQEPISDYGDYLIADLVNYYAMGTNFSLARQDLRKWAWVMENAKYQTFHTSYIFYWLQSLLNYYDYTGDKSDGRPSWPQRPRGNRSIQFLSRQKRDHLGSAQLYVYGLGERA